MGAQADEARGRPAAENEEALREAALYERMAEVRVLLAAGTAPDAADGDGRTALHLAALMGHEEAVGALAEGGADLDKADNWGATPLMNAARWGESGVVRRLLALGAGRAPPSLTLRCAVTAPIHRAAAKGDVEVQLVVGENLWGN